MGGLVGTGMVFAFNVVVLGALAGLGLAVRRGFGLEALNLDDAFFSAWMGFGLVLLFLILWNFVSPIGVAAFGIVVVAGWSSIAASRRQLWTSLRVCGVSPAWGLASLLFGLWIANLSLASSTAWDTSLYHMQGVRWAIEYPVLPGLANLFGPLGFNNSSLLYDAMLSVGPFSGRSWHVANGALLWLFASHSLVSIGALHRQRAAEAPHAVFTSLLLAIPISVLARGEVSSFATVVPAGLVLLVAASVAFRLLSNPDRPEAERAYDHVCIAALLAASVAIKLSTAIVAAAGVGLAVVALVRGEAELGEWRTRTLTWMTAWVASLGLSWAGRGVVLSGYPLFPSQVLHLPVEWRVPAEHAQAEFDFVTHSARASASNIDYVSGDVTGLGAWFPNWLRIALEDPFTVAIPLAITLVAALALFPPGRESRGRRGATGRRVWWMLLPIAAALSGWFLAAPMPHYAEAFFWALAALATARAVLSAAPDRLWSSRLGRGALGLGLLPVLLLYSPGPGAEGGILELPLGIVRANLVIPPSGTWHKPTPASPLVSDYSTTSGLVLHVPSSGGAPRCWYAPLPCTPNPAPNLRLREEGRMRSGFRVDGVWDMRDWPERWRPELLPALRRNWRRSEGGAP